MMRITMSIEFGHSPSEQQLPADIPGPRGESLGTRSDTFPEQGITGLGFRSPHEDARVEAESRFQQEQDSLRASGMHLTALSRERSNGGIMGVGHHAYGFGADGKLRPVSISGAHQARIEQQTETIYRIESGVKQVVDATVGIVFAPNQKQKPPQQ